MPTFEQATAAVQEAMAEVEKPQTNEVIRDAATIRRDEFVSKVLAVRNENKDPPPPPAPTQRQATQRELEMEAGRRRQQQFVEIEKNRPKMEPPGPNEGTTTPVFRPGDKVPGMNEGHNGARVLSG